ncbi:MAG: aminotransferase class I/II-fold pyridoxal phosphate-dependent enzyme [Calditrichaeota bacterium]|nr:MAG: aminotransferase class I/II-fold pyridoxal phosphate-dependent enzyme [Calditrichota bacterium]
MSSNIDIQKFYNYEINKNRYAVIAQAEFGPQILRIATEVQELKAQGETVYDFTVGDFMPAQFRIPKFLQEKIKKAIDDGETHYPPGKGVLSLRKAVQSMYSRKFGMDFPLDSFVIASGARPLLYSLYRAVVDPGDKVIYAVPSWNNHYYVHLFSANGIAIQADRETRFLPTKEAIQPHIKDATLIVLNSPLNPSGTVFSKEALEGICDMVLEENQRRSPEQKPLYIAYDQIYWQITFGDFEHYSPVDLRPELAPFTVLIDGVSKSYAGTGLRVGWAAAPPDIAAKMVSSFGHSGCWAPRAEQVGVAEFLNNETEVVKHQKEFNNGVHARLELIYKHLNGMKDEGFPIDAIEPMGAIYLSVYFGIVGKTTKSGRVLTDNEEARKYLLERTGLAAIPFYAFGSDKIGWFRFSVGSVSIKDINEVMPKLREALNEIEF